MRNIKSQANMYLHYNMGNMGSVVLFLVNPTYTILLL